MIVAPIPRAGEGIASSLVCTYKRLNQLSMPVDHIASLVGSALVEAQTAATKSGSEPVLGAPQD